MRDNDFSQGTAAPGAASAVMGAPKWVWVVLGVTLAAAGGWAAWRYGSIPGSGQADRPNAVAISPEEYRPLLANLNEKKYAESRRAAEELLAKYPNDINAFSVVGASYLREGMEKSDAVLIEKAGEIFERMLFLLPQHIGAISDLATVKRLQGKYDEGIAILEAAKRDFPNAESLDADLALMREEERKARAR